MNIYIQETLKNKMLPLLRKNILNVETYSNCQSKQPDLLKYSESAQVLVFYWDVLEQIHLQNFSTQNFWEIMLD